MNVRLFLAALVTATLAVSAAATPAPADPKVPALPPKAAVAPPAAARVRVSPHETISLKADNNRVIIVYGRPYTKDPKTGAPRKIWGALVPAGRIWRLGADEATLLVTERSLRLGGVELAAGAYSLYLLPAEDGSAKLVVNRRIGQAGSDPYDAAQEVARIDLTREELSAPVDQLTLSLEAKPAGGAVLKIAWETTQYSVAYQPTP